MSFLVSNEDPTGETGGEKKKDPTELSIGNIVAWIVGGFSIIAGIAALFSQTITGIGFLVAGVFGMPPTRGMIESEFGIVMSRWFAVLGYLVILFLFAGISQSV
jgi:hypothetical protein